jgi:hypothetical protein
MVALAPGYGSPSAGAETDYRETLAGVLLTGKAGVVNAIVVTTIYEPRFLPDYLANLERYDHRGDTTLYIIPDRKTPASVGQAAERAAGQGFDVRCLEVEGQESILRRLGVSPEFIPWNTDNRRNVGFLAALADGCEVLVSIDDDNFCRDDEDFIGAHRGALGPTAREGDEERLATGAGWFNPCAMIAFDGDVTVYPRGLPYRSRSVEARPATASEQRTRRQSVAINAGLWLGDPDVDAVTRLALGPRGTAFRPPSHVLDDDLWMPIDSQNTALTRTAAAAYYYVRMQYPVRGLVLDRFGDIFSGYFAEKCAKHLGEAVRVGTPVADHRRSPHDLVQDLYHELAGIALLEDFAPWLREERLEGTTYPEAYASLAAHIDDGADRFEGPFWREGGRDFLRATAASMRTWLSALRPLA